MGYGFSVDVSQSGIDLRNQIRIQLTHNHYPPVPTSMVQVCIEALEACNGDEPDVVLALPDGITWRGKPSAPAFAIVEAHHLDSWLYWNQEEEVDA